MFNTLEIKFCLHFCFALFTTKLASMERKMYLQKWITLSKTKLKINLKLRTSESPFCFLNQLWRLT